MRAHAKKNLKNHNQLTQTQSADANLLAENERIRAQLQSLRQELLEKETLESKEGFLLQAISDSCPALIVLFRLDTLQAVYVSSSSQRMLGRNPEKLKVQPLGLRPEIHPDEHPQFDAIIVALHADDSNDTHHAIFKTAAGQGKAKWLSCYFSKVNVSSPDDQEQTPKIMFYGFDITAQKVHECAESNEREFLQACLENMSDAVVISDPHGNVLMVNKHLKALSLPELSSLELGSENNVTEIDHFAANTEFPAVYSPLYHVISGKHVSGKLIRVKSTASNSQIYLACHGAPITNAEGHRIGAVLSYHDVSDSFQTLKRLDFQNRLSNLLASNESAGQVAGQTEILSAAVQLVGTEVSEMAGRSVLVELWVQGNDHVTLKLAGRYINSEALFHAEKLDESSWATQVNRILNPLETESTLHLDLTSETSKQQDPMAKLSRHKTHELLCALNSTCSCLREKPQAFQNCIHYRIRSDDTAFAALLVFSEQYLPSDGLFAETLSNISFQFSNFLLRTNANERILKERDILKNVLINAPIAIALFDKNLRYVSLSARWISKTREVSKVESMGMIGHSFAEVPCRLPPQFEATMAKALLGQTISCDEDHFEDTHQETVFYRWAVQPWYVREHEIGGIVVHFDEINDLVSAREAAFENARMKSQFVANMSHEVRTPLNGILGMTQLLLETPLSPEQKLYTEAALASSKSLYRIVNDILDFSKIEAGKLDLCKSLFSIRDSLEERLAAQSVLASEKGISLAYFVSKKVPDSIFQDENRIMQILCNMISNAIKFTDSGGVFVEVSTLYKNHQEQLHFEVVDTGQGIAEQFIDRLFQPFSQDQTHRSRKIEGTGLGLSICKELVNLMNGSIGAENNPERGAKFWFSVPLDFHSQPASLQESSQTIQNLTLFFDPDPISGLALERYLTDHRTPFVRSLSMVETLEKANELLIQTEQVKQAKESKHQGTKVHFLISKNSTAEDPAFRKLLEELQMLMKDHCCDAVNCDLVILVPFGSRVSLFHENTLKLKIIHTPLSPRAFLELFRDSVNPQCMIRHEINQDSRSAQNHHFRTRSPARILVAEDNTVNQILVQKYLEKMGFQVEIAEHGAAAVEKALRQHYDLILMDCQMPQLDGFAASRKIRQWELASNAQRTPIVALTAHAFEENRVACINAGMDAHLSKPIQFSLLQKTINRYLSLERGPSEP